MIATNCRRGFAALALAAGLSAAPARADETAKAGAAGVYSRAVRSAALVVTPRGSLGTAWVVNRDKKWLITNQHVVGDDRSVRIVFPKFRGKAVVTSPAAYNRFRGGVTGRVLKVSVAADLALIQVDSVPEAAATLKLATTLPSPGEEVHSVGAVGVTSAMWAYGSGKVRAASEAMTWRGSDGRTRSARVLVTTVPLNRGDSGGPLLNDAGQIVGVNQGYQGSTRLVSLSIQAAEVKRFLDTGTPERGLRAGRGGDRDGTSEKNGGIRPGYSRPERSGREERRRPRAAPDSLDGLFAEAAAAKQSKDWKGAERALKKILDREPGNLRAGVELSWVYNETRQYKKAVWLAGAVTEMDDGKAAAWRELGFAQFKLGKHSDAVESLVKAVKRDKRDYVALEYLAEALDAVGRHKDAAEIRGIAKRLRR